MDDTVEYVDVTEKRRRIELEKRERGIQMKDLRVNLTEETSQSHLQTTPTSYKKGKGQNVNLTDEDKETIVDVIEEYE